MATTPDTLQGTQHMASGQGTAGRGAVSQRSHLAPYAGQELEVVEVSGADRAAADRHSGVEAKPAMNNVPWSDEDMQYLTDNWRRKTTTEIAHSLRRTRKSVEWRGYQMGLRKPLLEPREPRKRKRPNPTYVIVSGTASRAADYVRIHDGTPVYRCNADGAPNPAGACWKYGHGSLVLSDEEMIARAERKGWDANAWRRLS